MPSTESMPWDGVSEYDEDMAMARFLIHAVRVGVNDAP